MIETMLLSFGAKLVCALAAVEMVVWLLRRLDKRAGFDFKEFFDDLKNDPSAAAYYLAGRFIGACLLVGLVVAFS